METSSTTNNIIPSQKVRNLNFNGSAMVEQTFVELYLGGGHWSIISKCGQLVKVL
jgi:hypothetical protein